MPDNQCRLLDIIPENTHRADDRLRHRGRCCWLTYGHVAQNMVKQTLMDRAGLLLTSFGILFYGALFADFMFILRSLTIYFNVHWPSFTWGVVSRFYVYIGKSLPN